MKVNILKSNRSLLFTIVLAGWGFMLVFSGFTEPGRKPLAIADDMPVYGNWKTFTTADGVPDNKVFCVRVDGDRILAGTRHGLGVYENGKWSTIGVEDGLAHEGVLSIDVSDLTGDVWIGTMGGLTRWSGGRFQTFTQLNSGLPNDIIYSVVCDGKDVWVATGGGAGHYDTYSNRWGIYTEKNAPMHEPWTYGVCAGDDKIWIAAWGGGVIEYNPKTRKFRDYTDPDQQMELDVFPDDGVVHDITTGVSWAGGWLWVGTYFGLSRYDGVHWKGYFDDDSGLLSNFINFVKANGKVGWICTDKGLSSFDGETWVNYVPNEHGNGGMAQIIRGKEKQTINQPASLANIFILGIDFRGDEVWVATSGGLSYGTLIK